MKHVKKWYLKYKNIDPEIRRYRKNWIVIYFMSSLVGMGFFITIPSLHQFVTSTSNPEDSNIQPGLGLSETWYSLIVSVSSVGEFTGAITMGFLIRHIYTKHLMLMNLSICALGGIFYSIGRFGWMLLIGRFCVGLFQGGQMTILRAYIGETSNTVIAMLPPEKQKKSTIKYTNFFLVFTMSTLCNAIGPGLGAIAAQIPGLDQFRWPGYWLIFHPTVLAILVLLVYREKKSDLTKGGTCCVLRKLPIPFYAILYLIFAFLISNWYVPVLDTLENPILSDNFGLSIKYTAYVFLGTLIFFAIGNTAVYLFRKCGLDIRITCLCSFILCISGSIIFSDWQAIRGDPCDQFSEENFKVPMLNTAACKITPEYVQTMVVDLNNTVCEQVTNSVLGNPLELEYFGTCTNYSQETLSVLMNGCLAANKSHDLVCGLSTADNMFYPLRQVDCFWESKNVCITFNTNINNSSFYQLTALLYSDINANSSRSLESCFSDTDTSSCFKQNNNSIDFGTIEDLDYCDSNASYICEAFSGSPYNCFWNPASRITGQYCSRCEPLCRSTDHTLNFIQFALGVSLITPGYVMSRITLTLLTSDAMGAASQGLIMGVLVATGSVARFSGPLWGNAAYLAVGRRTYLAMSILSSLMLVVMALFLLLYRTLKPKGVYLTPVRTEEEGDELEEAVGYCRDSDRVKLLKHFQIEEEISNVDDTGCEEATEGASWHGTMDSEADSAPLLGVENI